MTTAAPLGTLDVTIREARDLHNSDITGVGDPYCVVSFGTEQHKTYTVHNNVTNPVWHNESFHCRVYDAEADLIISVFDENTQKDACLGQIRFTLKELDHGMEVDEWFPLRQRNARDGPVSGDLHVSIQYSHNSVSDFINKLFEVGVEEPKGPLVDDSPPFSSRQFVANASELVELVWPAVELYRAQVDLFLWTDRGASLVGLLLSLFLSVYASFIPIVVPAVVAGRLYWKYVTGTGAGAANEMKHSDTGVGDKSARSVYKRKLRVVQNGMREMSVLVRSVNDIFAWKEPARSQRVLYMVLAVMGLWAVFPFRYTLFVASLYAYTRYTKLYKATRTLIRGYDRMYSHPANR